MKTITRTKDRIKQTGEVFTPLALVDEIIDKLDPKLFKDPTKTFIDNSCGDGNFLVRIIAKKIHHGSTVLEALSTTYGVEMEGDNTDRCRQRVLFYAYMAEGYGRNELVPRSIHELGQEHQLMERLAGDAEYRKFVSKYKYIVDQRIVCHDALKYEYDFAQHVGRLVDRPVLVSTC